MAHPALGAPTLYRGLAKPISGAKSVDEICERAGLNWKTESVPVQYTYGGKLYNGDERALLRSDNAKELAIVSDKFKIHQNTQIVDGLAKMAEAGHVKVTHGGSLEGGAVVFLHGTAERQFDLLKEPNPETVGKYYKPVKDSRKIGDIVRLDFSLRGGHRPGTPFVMQAVSLRLACYNGATSTAEECMLRLSHLQSLEKLNAGAINDFVTRNVAAFETYEQKARRLLKAKMDKRMQETYAIELVQPNLLDRVIEATKPIVAGSSAPVKLTGAQLLSEIMEHEDIVGKLIAGDFAKKNEELKLDRSTKQLLGVIENQPGYEMSKGTAWNAYNAVTYFVDHVRGRNDDHCVESSFQGNGAKLKSRALELAVEYTERLRA